MVFNYDKYIDETIKEMEFNPSNFTRDQKYHITEPMEAPENYHCDGEITPLQAKARWINNLKKSGLTKGQILLVRQKVGI
jgi:hypothetical protein